MNKHKFGTFRHLELNGRIQKNIRENPTWERIVVRRSLKELNLTYREMVAFINPYHNDYAQWLDFVVSYKMKLYAILFKAGHARGGATKAELVKFERKIKFLREKGIKYIILNRNDNSQMQTHLIETFLERNTYESKSARGDKE